MGSTNYDAIIVGAGPAGGQCARALAKQGFRILLIDRAKTFQENNYSSGGAPLELMSAFSLPNSIVGSFWNRLTIRSDKETQVWKKPDYLGPILDFDKLRGFLCREAEEAGADFLLGHKYLRHEQRENYIELEIKDLLTQETHRLNTKMLVDATGTERKVLAGTSYNKRQAIAATGVEYHIRVSPEVYHEYAESLNFFLGRKWMPQGYSWIFPMGNQCLKVGVIRYFSSEKWMPFESSYQPYLEQMLNLCGSYEVLDRHGKTLHFTKKQKDVRQWGNLLAIGDAITGVNPLGSEGIRHAMETGQIAAEVITDYFKGQKQALQQYDKKIDKYFGWRWRFSELLMHNIFKMSKDSQMDATVKSFSLLTTEQLLDVVFQYKYRHLFKTFFYYYLVRACGFFRGLK